MFFPRQNAEANLIALELNSRCIMVMAKDGQATGFQKLVLLKQNSTFNYLDFLCLFAKINDVLRVIYSLSMRGSRRRGVQTKKNPIIIQKFRVFPEFNFEKSKHLLLHSIFLFLAPCALHFLESFFFIQFIFNTSTYLKFRFLKEKWTSTIPVVLTRVLKMSCSVGW